MRNCARSSGRAATFPADEAAVKLLWLALRDDGEVETECLLLAPAMNQFAILYKGRFTPAVRSPASHTKLRTLPLPPRTDQRQLLAPPAPAPPRTTSVSPLHQPASALCTNQRQLFAPTSVSCLH
jgi:hypothetical protein